MPRVLYVGDPHVVREELGDARALLDYVAFVARQNQLDRIVFLGDQYHTHSIMHVEVLEFWLHHIRALAKIAPVLCLVGNHDRPGTEGVTASSMLAHERDCQVVSTSEEIDGVLYVSHMSSPDSFVEVCNNSPCRAVVCHQTFLGVVFDNNYHPTDGVDPNLLHQNVVISGHIHRPQQQGKVWYPGAPRWRTLSDANTERAIWVVQHDGHGTIQKRVPYSTAPVCRQIHHLVDSPDAPVSTELDPRHRWQIDLRGPAEWVDRRKAELARPGVRLRVFKESLKSPAKVRESDGVAKAFHAYLKSFSPPMGTPKERLEKLVLDRVRWEKS